MGTDKILFRPVQVPGHGARTLSRAPTKSSVQTSAVSENQE